MKISTSKMILILSSLLLQCSLFAKEAAFSTEMEAYFQGKSSKDILKVLNAVEDTCDTSCQYIVKNIKEMGILETDSEGRPLYVYEIMRGRWGIGGYTAIRVMHYKQEGETLHISSTYPGDDLLNYLEEKYNIHHNAPFYFMEVKWTLREKKDSSGHVKGIKVSYSLQAASEKRLMRMASKKVQREMDESAEIIFDYFMEAE